MKRYCPGSLFRATFLILIIFLSKQNILFILAFIFLLIINKKELFLFILLTLILLFHINLKLPLKSGYVVNKGDKEYIICHFLYCGNYLYSENLDIGDYVIFNAEQEETNIKDKRYDIYQKGNIKELKILRKSKLLYFKIRNNIFKLDKESSAYLRRLLYRENNYEILNDNIYLFSFGYYRLIKLLLNKKQKLYSIAAYIISFLQIISFGYIAEMLLLLIDFLCQKIFLTAKEEFALKIILIMIINPFYILRLSIKLPLIFLLFNSFETDLNYSAFLLLIESYYFGSINFIRHFLFNKVKYLSIIIYFWAVLVAFIPVLSSLFLDSLSFLLFILNNLSFTLKGHLTLFNIVLFLIFIYIFKFKNKYIQSVLIILILILRLYVPYTYLSFIDIGQGDAIYFEDRYNQINFLIDTGDSFNYYKLKKYLDERSIYSINYLIITHADADHSANIDLLKNDYKIKEIIQRPETIKKNDFILQSFPLQKFNDKNADSLIYALDINNLNFLFTGDMTKISEKDFIHKYMPYKVNILKAAHHGSNTSSSLIFLKEINPEIVIISTNGWYGHPHQETIDSINKISSTYYTTKEEGTITFIFFPHITILNSAGGILKILRN